MMKLRSTLVAVALLLPLGSSLFLPEAAQARSLNRLNPNANTTQIAQRGPGGPGGPGEMDMKGDRLAKLKQELGLSDAQVQQLQTIHQNAQTQSQGLRDQLRTARDDMQKLMTSRAPESQLRSQHQKIQGLMQQLGDQRFETELAVRRVLTPEQQTKLAQLMEQRMEQRGDRAGARPQGGMRRGNR